MEERSDESSERREGREIEEIYIYVERQRSSAKRVLHDRIEENTGRKNLHLNSPHLISKIFTFDFVRRAKRESSRATPLLLFCLCLRRRLEILRTSGDDVCVRVFPLCISSNILRWSASIVFASSAHYPLTGAETRIEK